MHNHLRSIRWNKIRKTKRVHVRIIRNRFYVRYVTFPHGMSRPIELTGLYRLPQPGRRQRRPIHSPERPERLSGRASQRRVDCRVFVLVEDAGRSHETRARYYDYPASSLRRPRQRKPQQRHLGGGVPQDDYYAIDFERGQTGSTLTYQTVRTLSSNKMFKTPWTTLVELAPSYQISQSPS